MDSARLEVRVQPKAKRNAVEVLAGGGLKVHVTAAPTDGKANAAVVALLAKRLGVAKGALQVLRGHRSRDKLLLVNGLEPEEVLERLGLQRADQELAEKREDQQRRDGG